MPFIGPDRVDLAEEFRRRPFGDHSPDLQYLLHLMRSQPIEGKHFLYMTEPHAEWVLARMSEDPPLRAQIGDQVFTRIEDAEWAVFTLRWTQLMGQPLELE